LFHLFGFRGNVRRFRQKTCFAIRRCVCPWCSYSPRLLINETRPPPPRRRRKDSRGRYQRRRCQHSLRNRYNVYINKRDIYVAFIHKFFNSFPRTAAKSHQRERLCLQPTLLTREGSYSDDLVAITVVSALAPVMLLPATVEIRSGGDAFILLLLLLPLFS